MKERTSIGKGALGRANVRDFVYELTFFGFIVLFEREDKAVTTQRTIADLVASRL